MVGAAGRGGRGAATLLSPAPDTRVTVHGLTPAEAAAYRAACARAQRTVSQQTRILMLAFIAADK